MLACPAEFPHAGSRAFERGSGAPLTIIQRNADGTCLVRRDPKFGELRNRNASGNARVAFADLAASEDEALLPIARRRRRAQTASSSAAVGRKKKTASSSAAVGRKKKRPQAAQR